MERLVNIGGREYRLRYGLRSFFLYENITGKPFDGTKTFNLYTLNYAMVLASNDDVTMTLDEFIDACDADPSIFQTFLGLLEEEAKKASQFVGSKKKVVEKR